MAGAPPARRGEESFDQQEARAIAEFSRHFRITFHDPELLRLALTHRSYLSVTGMGPRESNERMEFLGDSVLGLVTSEYLYRLFPDEHEGQLTKTKSLLVSKAILSRKALSMGLGRFVLLSRSEVDSGGRQRLSILADAFESVVAAIYLDQGFEAAREFIEYWLLRGSREIVADKRHRNYKSHLQEYVQSTFRTHPVYRIRSQMGPDHSKLFLVEVMVGRRALGEGRGPNKKEAEQAAARDALESVERPGQPGGGEREEHESRPEGREERGPRREGREEREPRREGREEREPRREVREEREPRREVREEREPRREAREAPVAPPVTAREPAETDRDGFRSRRSGHGRRGPGRDESVKAAPVIPDPARVREPVVERTVRPAEVEPPLSVYEEDSIEEIGRPEGPLDERHIDPFGIGAAGEPTLAEESPELVDEAWTEADAAPAWESPEVLPEEPVADRFEDQPEADVGGDEVTEDEAPGPVVSPPENGPTPETRFGRRRARRR
jgi:ribonuclease III